MSNLCFLSDRCAPNYIDSPFLYKYRKGAMAFTGKYVHSDYIYWILYNHNIPNIKLVKNTDDVGDDDILFFHYDFKDKINTERRFKKVQIVSDRPKIAWADYYCLNNPAIIKDEFLLFEPLPYNLKTKNTNFPPSKFHCNCLDHFILDEFKESKNINNLKNQGINITFESNLQFTEDEFDVFFFIRNKNYDLVTKSKKQKHFNLLDNKHFNRLLQSWIMEVPAILNTHSSIESIKQSELDYLTANSYEEFLDKCLLIKTNKDLFFDMIENCKKRKKEWSNTLIVNQILDIRSILSK